MNTDEYRERTEVEPGCKVILKDGRCVAVHDRLADLIFVRTNESRWETHVSEVEEVEETDAFKPEGSWF